eukprot:CAMPEP_0117498594 /NCGR_PEP_ID=MMETSP0784-20121206/21796_1 /TAXON_ID=39447 /ORGANISM="" /LENGTH=321 /DNA_ID=CAMNT_0005293687 /DNA_START=19 /DNA_END=984 /DNA_ORIENTATION=+
MAPKKKPPGKDGEADPFDDFIVRYNKIRKEFPDVPKIREAEEYITAIKDLGTEEPGATSWNFTEEFDPMAFRILHHALRGFNDLKAVRVWKCNGGDESVRSVCYYIDSTDPQPGVTDLQFVANGVTALGCEFLGKTLGPSGNKVVDLLRLDYNPFGTEGVEKLSLGLSQNSTLRHLSLQFCNIGEDGGQYLAHILMFHRCALEKLELRGNYLRERGVVDVFHGARRTKQLSEIDLFGNQFTDTPEVIEAIKDLFQNNVNIKKYNLGGNMISDTGAQTLVTGMIGLGHLQSVIVTERASTRTFEALEQLRGGAGKKKGKKKK